MGMVQVESFVFVVVDAATAVPNISYRSGLLLFSLVNCRCFWSSFRRNCHSDPTTTVAVYDLVHDANLLLFPVTRIGSLLSCCFCCCAHFLVHSWGNSLLLLI